jgi:hypothetical protein
VGSVGLQARYQGLELPVTLRSGFSHMKVPPGLWVLKQWLLFALQILGEFVTREHIHHHKSEIAHRGRTKIHH